MPWTEKYRGEAFTASREPLGISWFLQKHGLDQLWVVLATRGPWGLVEEVGVRGIYRSDSVVETMPLVLELALLKYAKPH